MIIIDRIDDWYIINSHCHEIIIDFFDIEMILKRIIIWKDQFIMIYMINNIIILDSYIINLFDFVIDCYFAIIWDY